MNITDLLHAVDAHAEGELTRVVVGGLPVVEGTTMAEKRRTLLADDALRRYVLNLGPELPVTGYGHCGHATENGEQACSP